MGELLTTVMLLITCGLLVAASLFLAFSRFRHSWLALIWGVALFYMGAFSILHVVLIGGWDMNRLFWGVGRYGVWQWGDWGSVERFGGILREMNEFPWILVFMLILGVLGVVKVYRIFKRSFKCTQREWAVFYGALLILYFGVIGAGVLLLVPSKPVRFSIIGLALSLGILIIVRWFRNNKFRTKSVQAIVSLVLMFVTIGACFQFKSYKKERESERCFMITITIQKLIISFGGLNGLNSGASIDITELIDDDGYISELPICPAGGDYTYLNLVPDSITAFMSCSIHGTEKFDRVVNPRRFKPGELESSAP